jgi:hypothetical protein
MLASTQPERGGTKMFGKIAKLLKIAQNNEGHAHYQPNPPANASQNEANLEWKSMNITRLDTTNAHLRSIEANMAAKTRAEFAAVTKALNASQHVDRSEKDLIKN